MYLMWQQMSHLHILSLFLREQKAWGRRASSSGITQSEITIVFIANCFHKSFEICIVRVCMSAIVFSQSEKNHFLQYFWDVTKGIFWPSAFVARSSFQVPRKFPWKSRTSWAIITNSFRVDNKEQSLLGNRNLHTSFLFLLCRRIYVCDLMIGRICCCIESFKVKQKFYFACISIFLHVPVRLNVKISSSVHRGNLPPPNKGFAHFSAMDHHLFLNVWWV